MIQPRLWHGCDGHQGSTKTQRKTKEDRSDKQTRASCGRRETRRVTPWEIAAESVWDDASRSRALVLLEEYYNVNDDPNRHSDQKMGADDTSPHLRAPVHVLSYRNTLLARAIQQVYQGHGARLASKPEPN